MAEHDTHNEGGSSMCKIEVFWWMVCRARGANRDDGCVLVNDKVMKG